MAPTRSSREFCSLLTGPMVRLQKSNPSHEWLIHKNLLCHHTTYFKDVLIDGCDTISMIAWSDSSVEFFVQWLYQGDITYDLSLHFENSRPIVDLYYMAQDLKIHALANLAIDHFRQICNRYRVVPDVANLQHVYSKLRGRTPLRVLVARMVAHYVLTSDPSRQSETSRKFWLFAATHAEFGIDFTAALQREVANGLLDPAAGDGEMYHELENADGGSWCPAIDGDDRPYVRASSASSSPPPPYSRDIQSRREPSPISQHTTAPSSGFQRSSRREPSRPSQRTTTPPSGRQRRSRASRSYGFAPY